MPYQDYAYGYHIPPIFKEKIPLRASTIVVNNHQHHYHSSGTDNTCIFQFFLTSHSITSMGHAYLVEILQICCIFFLLAGGPLGSGYLGPGAIFFPYTRKSRSLSLSLSLCMIQKRNYNVFWLYSSS